MSAQPIDAKPHAAPLASPAGGMTRSGRLRVEAIDMLRGLVIVIMVLDHVRDFFHRTAWTADPLAMDSGDPALFATRWITHFCAPTFVFLAGVSAWLQKANGKSDGDLSRFLVTRGLWLILLELTLVTIGFNFGWFAFMQVIWAIGIGMVILALLVRLPARLVLAIGLVIVFGHNALASVQPADLGAAGPLWAVGMEFGPLPLNLPGFMSYPAIPWLGVMLVGYGLGGVFTLERSRRDRTLIWLGLASIVLFVLTRMANVYGDPRPWAVQGDPLWTVFSFINATKYPPSLDYLLMTLGPALLLIPALERLRGPVASVLLTFGRTPLFTYLLHIYVAHGLAMLIGVVMGVPASAFFDLLGDPSRALEAGWGFGLGPVYLAWIAVLILLYPAARWFEGVKRRRRDWWLGYL